MDKIPDKTSAQNTLTLEFLLMLAKFWECPKARRLSLSSSQTGADSLLCRSARKASQALRLAFPRARVEAEALEDDPVEWPSEEPVDGGGGAGAAIRRGPRRLAFTYLWAAK